MKLWWGEYSDTIFCADAMTTKTMSAVGAMQKFVSLDGKKPQKTSRDRHSARPDLQHLRSRRLLLTRFFQFAREYGDLLLKFGVGYACSRRFASIRPPAPALLAAFTASPHVAPDGSRRWPILGKSSLRAVAGCPLWVISGRCRLSDPCPLYPRKRTCAPHKLMSALGQKRTWPENQVSLFAVLVDGHHRLR